MKLSQALEAGIGLVPERCEHAYFHQDHGQIIEACVLGTVAAGSLGTAYRRSMPESILDTLFQSEYRMDDMFVNPVTGDLETLFAVLRRLNDDYHWTREECLYWLKQQGL